MRKAQCRLYKREGTLLSKSSEIHCGRQSACSSRRERHFCLRFTMCNRSHFWNFKSCLKIKTFKRFSVGVWYSDPEEWSSGKEKAVELDLGLLSWFTVTSAWAWTSYMASSRPMFQSVWAVLVWQMSEAILEPFEWCLSKLGVSFLHCDLEPLFTVISQQNLLTLVEGILRLQICLFWNHLRIMSIRSTHSISDDSYISSEDVESFKC